MISIDLNKAKNIGHNIRRQQRDLELEPLDNLIAKKIPGKSEEEIEAERQAIRDKYAQVQVAINEATTPEEIKFAIGIN